MKIGTKSPSMKCLIVLAIVTFVAGAVIADTVVLNEAVDELLAGIKQEIAAKGKDVMPVPDCSKDWHWRKAFIKISGNINCHGGTAGRLTTLRRTGDVTMTTTPNTITLHAKMGLGDLWAHFDKCQAKVHHLLSVSHRIEASVDGNSVDAQITLTHDGNSCVAKVDHIYLDQIGKIHIKLGGSVFQKVLDKLLDMIANHFRSRISDEVNKILANAAASQLPKIDLCKKIPH